MPEHEPSDASSSSDAIKAYVLRAALIVLMLMGIPVIGLLVYLNVKKTKDKSNEVEVDVVYPDVIE